MKIESRESFMRKQQKQPSKKIINLPLDSRNRICLTQFLPKYLEISSYKACLEGERIILEPMSEVPAHEAWLYSNPKALASVLKGIKQAEEGRVSKLDIDLSQFLDDDEV